MPYNDFFHLENKMKHYYAGYNAYGIGTANCWTIYSFDSKSIRDDFARDDRCEKLTAKETRRRINGGNALGVNDQTMRLLGYSSDIYTQV
jgi:hypothetical protein